MEKIAIITDSCSDVSKEYREKYDIYVLPMVVQHNEKEYKDGIDITAEDIYRLQENDILKTASPAGSDVLDTFEEIKKKGYTHAIVVSLASGLSGTFNSIRLMAMDEEDLTIEVYDTKSGSIGYGAIAVLLAKYRDEGLSFEELKQKALFLIENCFVYFSIDTLEHLQRGGRIGKATAFVGTLMKIKPILSFEKETGEIYVPAKVRGKKAVLPQLVSLVEKHITDHPDKKFFILTADGGSPKEREELETRLKEKFPQMEGFLTGKIGAALSTYLGSGLLGAGVVFL